MKRFLFCVFLFSVTISYSQNYYSSTYCSGYINDSTSFFDLYNSGCPFLDGDMYLEYFGQSQNLPDSVPVLNLEIINGYLEIQENFELQNLSFLSNLEEVESIYISQAANLESLNGLENLWMVQDDFIIENNLNLNNISAINNISSIGSLLILDNISLVDCQICDLLNNLDPQDVIIENNSNFSGNCDDNQTILINICGSTIDCMGDVGGTAYIDSCGECVGGFSGILGCEYFDNNYIDCSGDGFGGAYIDNCGNCVGGSTGLLPCDIETNSLDAFSYQAVYRDSSGNVVSNQNIEVLVSIVSDSINGSIIYSESHNIVTSSFGLFNLQIGRGLIQSGNFNLINWPMSTHFLNIQIALTNSQNYIDMGSAEILSVPYAMYAKNSGEILPLYLNPDVHDFECGTVSSEGDYANLEVVILVDPSEIPNNIKSCDKAYYVNNEIRYIDDGISLNFNHIGGNLRLVLNAINEYSLGDQLKWVFSFTTFDQKIYQYQYQFIIDQNIIDCAYDDFEGP